MVGAAVLDAETAALAFFAAGVAVGVGILPDRSLRTVLAALGFFTLAWCLALRLEGLPIVVALTVLVFAAVATMRLLPAIPEARVRWHINGLLPASMADMEDLRPVLDHSVAGAIIVAGGWAAAALLLDEGRAPGYAWAVVIAWTALAVAATWMVRVDRAGGYPYVLGAAVGLAASASAAFFNVAPPSRLVVDAGGVDPLVAIQTALALGVLAAGVAFLAASTAAGPWRQGLWILAGLALFYLLSVAPVDVIATQVGKGMTSEELKTQGQVALSVTWAVVGVAAFVAGLRRQANALRQAGLAILGLATTKVFVFDLAALEIAYRVISLIALGLLLLASAWVWQRLQPKADPSTEQPPI